jgi:hypothetical protein
MGWHTTIAYEILIAYLLGLNVCTLETTDPGSYEGPFRFESDIGTSDLVRCDETLGKTIVIYRCSKRVVGRYVVKGAKPSVLDDLFAPKAVEIDLDACFVDVRNLSRRRLLGAHFSPAEWKQQGERMPGFWSDDAFGQTEGDPGAVLKRMAEAVRR